MIREKIKQTLFQTRFIGDGVTPQELTDDSGDTFLSAKYRALRQPRSAQRQRIDIPLRFQGQYFDAETGLHYNRHRYYNPGLVVF